MCLPHTCSKPPRFQRVLRLTMSRLGSVGCLGKPDQLASGVWLCAAAGMYQSRFEMWNDHPILVKWMNSKSTRNQEAVAGSGQQTKTSKVISGCRYSCDGSKAKRPSQPALAEPSGSIPAAAARKLEAPIEEKFKQQAAEWEEFKKQQKSSLLKLQSNPGLEVQQLQQDVKHLKEVVAKQCRSFEQQNELNAKECGATRQESKEQFAQFAATLQDSLKQSLAKQPRYSLPKSPKCKSWKNFLQNNENSTKKAPKWKWGPVTSTPNYRSRGEIPKILNIALGKTFVELVAMWCLAYYLM